MLKLWKTKANKTDTPKHSAEALEPITLKEEDEKSRRIRDIAEKHKLKQQKEEKRQKTENEATEEEQEEQEEKKRALASYYLPRRKLGRAVKRVSRSHKTDLLILLLSILVLVVFIFASAQESVGNFTINLDKLDMYNRGISLSETADFVSPKSRLEANQVKDATNITYFDLPDNLDEIDGSHNGDDYMAYTFYLRNGGKENVDYLTNIAIEAKAKNVDAAVRVALYKNGVPTIYAKPATNGSPEPNTMPFINENTVMEGYVEKFAVGQVDKYTVVIWLEGNDPDCIDAILGGMIRLSMNIKVVDPEEKQEIDYQEV